MVLVQGCSPQYFLIDKFVPASTNSAYSIWHRRGDNFVFSRLVNDKDDHKCIFPTSYRHLALNELL